MLLGERIRFFRNRASKSQKDIEAETNIPQTTLSGWETGVSEPRASELQKLATAFGVTVTELLTEQTQTDCINY